MERALIDDYRDSMKAILSDLTTESYEDALQLADLPKELRGFGPVKHASATAYQEKQTALKAKYLEMKSEKRAA
jgi:indolepyruvate ferredoxin oxidoreductase